MQCGVVLSPPQIEMLVPGTFDGTIRLRRLLLHNNPVRTLEHFSFPPLRHLKLVDLSHCQLRTVGLSTFQGLAASLEELKLEVRRAVRETMRLITNLSCRTTA